MNHSVKLGLLCLFCLSLPLVSTWNGISLGGKKRFLLGVDYPWLNYGNDFGENSWGAYGVSTKVSTINPAFANLSKSSGNTVRWWLFCDGRAGILNASDGSPTGLDPQVFKDLDAAVQIAKNNNIYLNLVLFDFSILYNASSNGGVQMGGRIGWFTTHLQALINNVVIPVLTRYATATSIFSWEIMNEPEWILSDIKYPSVNSQAQPLTQQQFFTFAKQVADAVHAHTKQYVTVGSACLKWYRIWTPAYATQNKLPVLNLDYYQTHYYSWMDPYTITNDTELGTVTFSPNNQLVSGLKDLDKPIIVGEFVQSGTSEFSQFLKNGYAGAWAWSVNADYPISFSAISTWAKSNANVL